MTSPQGTPQSCQRVPDWQTAEKRYPSPETLVRGGPSPQSSTPIHHKWSLSLDVSTLTGLGDHQLGGGLSLRSSLLGQPRLGAPEPGQRGLLVGSGRDRSTEEA